MPRRIIRFARESLVRVYSFVYCVHNLSLHYTNVGAVETRDLAGTENANPKLVEVRG